MSTASGFAPRSGLHRATSRAAWSPRGTRGRDSAVCPPDRPPPRPARGGGRRDRRDVVAIPPSAPRRCNPGPPPAPIWRGQAPPAGGVIRKPQPVYGTGATPFHGLPLCFGWFCWMFAGWNRVALRLRPPKATPPLRRPSLSPMILRTPANRLTSRSSRLHWEQRVSNFLTIRLSEGACSCHSSRSKRSTR